MPKKDKNQATDTKNQEQGINFSAQDAEHQEQKPRKSGMQKVTAFVLIALGTLLLGLLAFVGRLYYVAKINPQSAFENKPAVQPAATSEPSAKQEKTPEPEATLSPEEELLSQADLNFMNDRVNILLLGVDISPEREGTARSDFRTDVMLLLSVDFANGHVYMVSIPRDSYAKIYNTNARYKINGAFALGGGLEGDGFEYAKQTISLLFGGVPVHYHAAVEMAGIKKLVDVMGGVDYDVDVEIRLNGRVLKKGMQHLDGQQVLDYCRARKGISTDLGRIDRQQRMLFEVFRQLKSSKQLVKLPKMYMEVQDSVFTDLNIEQIAALAAFALDIDPDTDIERYTLEGEYMEAYNASYFVLYQSRKVKLVKEVFGVTIKPQNQYDVGYVRRDSAIAKAEKSITRAKSVLGKTPSSEARNQLESQTGTLSTLVKERAATNEIEKATQRLEQLITACEKAQNTAAPGTASTPAPSQPSAPSPTPSQSDTPPPTQEPVTTQPEVELVP